MTSNSKTAQERLTSLEKTSAPFEAHLLEAEKFVGITISSLDQRPFQEKRVGGYHGREEWLLRWILKKLGGKNDVVPRSKAESWLLLGWLVQSVPRTTAARLLVERKFTGILRATLEEVGMLDGTEMKSEGVVEKSGKNSKKRKRTPVSTSDSGSRESLLQLLKAIHTALIFITSSTKDLAGEEVGRDSAFKAEYMRTTIKTTAEEAAIILGLWMSLSLLVPKANSTPDTWLSPFIELWQASVAGDNALELFSVHCTKPLLQLLQESRWESDLEQLAARNILIPARSDMTRSPESRLINTLTTISVTQDPANAPMFFHIAVRSIQTHGSGRRKPQDDLWLQTVFNTLQEGFMKTNHAQICKALQAMLQSATKFKVKLDLPTLREVASKYALPEDNTNWELVAGLLRLDGNVFLIPSPETDLLERLLRAITKLPCGKSEYAWSENIASDVMIPLMNEFAKARDLDGFIRHWYTELRKFTSWQHKDVFSALQTELVKLFTPWEQAALQDELAKLLEPSLTLHQITQTIDWLEAEVKTSTGDCDIDFNGIDSASVLLQAISGSISREETVDAIGFRLCSIVLENELAKFTGPRDKWRAFSITSQSLAWIQLLALEAHLEELVAYLEKCADVYIPAEYDLKPIDFSGQEESAVALRVTEIFKCVCAMRTVVEAENQLGKRLEKLVLNFAKFLVRSIDALIGDLSSGNNVGVEKCGMPQHAWHRGSGWLLWSLVRCLFVEYPMVLTVLPKLQGEDAFRGLIQTVYWIASASDFMGDIYSIIPWFAHNPKAFPDLWNSVLQNELILNSPSVTGVLVDVMLRGENKNNPLLDQPIALDTFAVRSLIQTSLEIFSKKDREVVATKWAPTAEMISMGPSLETNIPALDPAVLSLQVKIMHRPTFYENMSYQDLLTLAESFENGCIVSHKATLAIFKKLVKLTITQMISNPDQARTKEYLTRTVKLIKDTVKSIDSKNKGKEWTYALIALFDSTLAVLQPKLKILTVADIVSESKFQKLLNGLKSSVLDYFGTILRNLVEGFSKGRIIMSYSLALLCLLDALPNLGATSSELATFKEPAAKLAAFEDFMNDRGFETGKRLHSFLAAFGQGSKEESFIDQIRGDVSTIYGRQSIIQRSKAAVLGKDQAGKLKLLNSILGEDSLQLTQLDRLLAVRQIVLSLEDTRKRSEEDDEDEDDDFDMSSAYAILCGYLWKTKGVRQFCLISETMVLMLRKKGRCISQWNIDSTLSAITIICSRNGPSLRSNRAGTIYLNLCNLMQAVLNSHRLKLQGHFHLVVQVMQTLLRCLFIPLRHSTTKTTKFMAPPPWLSSPKYQLAAKDAAAYTRLITLISNPSVSSVTRSQHNSLTSATAKAKGMAAQHMQFVLTTYIRLQLEMRMLPEIREKMVPGLYAIFDTTTPEMRRMIHDSLDASGRSVFTTLFRDYQKFGKWKGS